MQLPVTEAGDDIAVAETDRLALAGRMFAAFVCGALAVFAFAPFELFPLAPLSLAALAALLQRTASVRHGLLLGLSWGMGLFAAGISWLFVALHRYGGMPMPLAGTAIALFCAYLALYPALVGGLFVRFGRDGALRRATLFGGLWLLGEVLRGWVFTGFPWLAIGYSQTPPSPLAGYLPLVGVYGLSGILAFLGALLAFVRWRELRVAVPAVVIVLFVLGAGQALRSVEWTAPAGDPLRVALLQTNIEQGLKWRPERLSEWLDVNAQMVAEQSAALVVLPETTLPLLADQLPEGYLDELGAHMRSRGADLVLGLFLRDAAGHIYNAALSTGSAPLQTYAKRHLVPFGEYSPPLFGWFYGLVDIPMSDQHRGPPRQAPIAIGGQRIAVNICYEDLFGRELLRSLPQATMLLNLSNLAWYGDSFAQPQHLQISRARAMETGRPMLRSTNTGMTAVVLPDGSVTGVLPAFERGALVAEVQGYEGSTPYARWGDYAALALAAIALAVGLARAGRRSV